jgi:hypothetical protein
VIFTHQSLDRLIKRRETASRHLCSQPLLASGVNRISMRCLEALHFYIIPNIIYRDAPCSIAFSSDQEFLIALASEDR